MTVKNFVTARELRQNLKYPSYPARLREDNFSRIIMANTIIKTALPEHGSGVWPEKLRKNMFLNIQSLVN